MNPQKKFQKHALAIAICGALGVPATAMAVPAFCPDQFDSPGPIQASAVTDEVIDNLDGTFDYSFRLCNLSAFVGPGPDFAEGLFIRDWELPFFGTDLLSDNEAGITDIFTAEGWHFALEEIGVANFDTGWDGFAAWQDPLDAFFDPLFAEGSHTYVLHFYTGCFEGGIEEEEPLECAPVAPGEEAEDFFGFTADYAPTAAPYQASWIAAPAATGDPAFPLLGGFPNSPSLQVPEPGTLALMSTGLLLGGAARRRKGKPKKDT